MESDRYINSDVLTEINNRQKNLVGDFSEHSAVVVGLGGIGNWVALDLALLGMGTLILYDNDKVEASNLNRTLFKLNHIGKSKVIAVKELISERRKDTIVITNQELFTVILLHLTGIIYERSSREI
jgi:tRNA A37 threonylcarbamoyladenosine dehydratase